MPQFTSTTLTEIDVTLIINTQGAITLFAMLTCFNSQNKTGLNSVTASFIQKDCFSYQSDHKEEAVNLNALVHTMDLFIMINMTGKTIFLKGFQRLELVFQCSSGYKRKLYSSIACTGTIAFPSFVPHLKNTSPSCHS